MYDIIDEVYNDVFRVIVGGCIFGIAMFVAAVTFFILWLCK